MLHTNIDVKHSPIDGHHLKHFMYLSNITHSNLLKLYEINDTYQEKMENTALSNSEQWELSTFVVS